MIKSFIKSLLRFFLRILWILPVNKKKALFISFEGSSISCSPFYISQALSKECPNLKIVWCSNNKEHHKLLDNYKNIKFVKKNSFSYIVENVTSKFLFSNTGFSSWVPFRIKTQILINTWHGGGAYKKIGISIKDSKELRKSEQRNAKNITYFISSSKAFTSVMKDSMLIEEKKFLSIGLPRNDIFFDLKKVEEERLKVYKKFNIPEDSFLILYAPTYCRFDQGITVDIDWNLNLGLLKNAAKKRFNKNVFLAYRGHYFDKVESKVLYDADFSTYPNMQELLCAADMLITDYSSSMWDFSLTKKPCILFCPNMEIYKENWGFYTDPKTWGFPIAKTNDELEKLIVNFEQNEYNKAIEKNHEYFGSFENGNATQKIVDLVKENLCN
jgi:CDP-glycerol glycerophosphotransferase